MANKKIIFELHGFKTPNKNDFESFNEYLKIQRPDYEVVTFNYFENNEKETLVTDLMDQKIISELEKYKDQELVIVAYSAGTTFAAKNLLNYDNYKKMIFICPTYKVSFTKWITLVNRLRKVKKKLKKKLGKERYKSLAEARSKASVKNKYPVKIIMVLWKYLRKNRELISKIKGKDIEIINSKIDYAINDKKNMRFINSYFDKENNNFKMSEYDDDHFSILEKSKTKFYDHLINLIDKNPELPVKKQEVTFENNENQTHDNEFTDHQTIESVSVMPTYQHNSEAFNFSKHTIKRNKEIHYDIYRASINITWNIKDQNTSTNSSAIEFVKKRYEGSNKISISTNIIQGDNEHISFTKNGNEMFILPTNLLKETILCYIENFANIYKFR